jgi:hypothetical protein
MTSSFLRAALVGLALSLVACGGTDTPDAASSGMDAPIASGSDTNPTPDAVTSPDAFSADDAPSILDAASSGDRDAVVIETDAGFEGDAGGIGPGECDTRVECLPTCFRPIRCVKECGGPETECGCCPCATGSIDSITCGTTG